MQKQTKYPASSAANYAATKAGAESGAMPAKLYTNRKWRVFSLVNRENFPTKS